MRNRIKRTLRFLQMAIFTAMPFVTMADTYSIGGDSGDDGGFGLITTFFQKYVDFMTGPFAKTAIAGTLIIAAILWAVMPKEGIFGTIVRVVIAALVAMNVATWMGMFGS